MERKLNITIPKPCHEDWNKMTPEQTGRFCSSCAKSVVDFTSMNPTEIQNYFVLNKEQKICGRFEKEQLDSIIIQIPREVLFSPMQFHKMFMLALLITMGTTLLSCQNNNGATQKIDEVKVVDSVERKPILGILLPEKLIPPKPIITQDSITGEYYESYPKNQSNEKCVKTKGEVVVKKVDQVKVVKTGEVTCIDQLLDSTKSKKK